MNKRIALLAGRIALAAIFIAAGYLKLKGFDTWKIAPDEAWLPFASSIGTFKLVPATWLQPIARTLPWCELALGLAILSGIALRWSALIASLLLAAFFAVLIRSYAMGLDVDCGCFGPGETLGPKRLAEEAVMLVLALSVTIGAFRQATRRYVFA